MIWIVKLDNPKPEKYIAVFERTSLTENRFHSKEEYSVFSEKSDAIQKANDLMMLYSVDTIRIFHEEGYSRNVKISD